MKSMAMRRHATGFCSQPAALAHGQARVKARQAPARVFARKKEHPHALCGKETWKDSLGLRPGAVAGESAIFFLGAACMAGEIRNDARLAQEARELDAIAEKSFGNEIRISDNGAASSENLFAFAMTVVVVGVAGLRLLRMAQAKLEKKGAE